jgi:sigma-E processing peptidase SpoIIGA
MEIYIEYALIENFLFDYALLYLAAKAANIPRKSWRICFSSAIGAVFALLFPLLRLPKILAYLLKFSIGFLMCAILVDGLKKENERGRYALTCIFFFIFTFTFGGVLSALTRDFFKKRVPTAFVVIGFAWLTAFSVYLIGKLHKKREIYGFLYDCVIVYQGKRKKIQGFWDNGNRASKNGLPICFLSPSLFYDVFLDEFLAKEGGQVCDELEIQTVGGIKKVALYKGIMEIQSGRIKKEVYFALSKNMLSREYSVLLPSCIFEKEGNYEEKSA